MSLELLSLEWKITINIVSICVYSAFFGYQLYCYRRDKPDAWLYPEKEREPLADLADLVKECEDKP